eukprot:22277_5
MNVVLALSRDLGGSIQAPFGFIPYFFEIVRARTDCVHGADGVTMVTVLDSYDAHWWCFFSRVTIHRLPAVTKGHFQGDFIC